jgi:hypothetical protein
MIDCVARERREHRVFTKLLQMVPGLEERLVSSSEEEVVFIADMVSICQSVGIYTFSLFRSLDQERGVER